MPEPGWRRSPIALSQHAVQALTLMGVPLVLQGPYSTSLCNVPSTGSNKVHPGRLHICDFLAQQTPLDSANAQRVGL